MGVLTNIFYKNEIIYREKMKDSVSNFMIQYAVDNDADMTHVAYIFANVQAAIRDNPLRDIRKAMKMHNLSAEVGALNMLQNFAMVEIESCEGTDFLLNRADCSAFRLFNAVNDYKLKHGYISAAQHEENKDLGLRLQLGLNLPF